MTILTTIGFCLWTVTACAEPGTKTDATPPGPSQQQSTNGDVLPCAIRFIQAASAEPPIRSAASCLQTFLQSRYGCRVTMNVGMGEKPAMPFQTGTILLGTPADTIAISRWIEAGVLKLAKATAPTSTASDAYTLALIDGCIVVAGASPRAVLYGAFELQDILAEHGRVPQSLQRRAEPRLGLRLLHPRFQGGFTSYRRSDFEFIARCGGNVAHLSHDWMAEKTLFSFVPCPEFPQATTPQSLEDRRAHLRKYLAWCQEFGLGGAMWLCEVPCQGGPWVPEATRQKFLERFPAECLSDTGTYQGKVLCLAHPTVDKAYRTMARRFFADFPGISMLLVFTLDSSGELCDPKACPRHQGVSKLTQYNRLLTLLQEEGRKARPDVQVISVGWSWHFRGDPQFVPQQAALPPGVGLASPPDGEAWSFDRKITDMLSTYRDATRRRGQLFLGYDIFLFGDDCLMPATKLFDFPIGIAKKCQRWETLAVDGVFDQWGTQAEYVQCDAVALREILFHAEYAKPENLSAWAESLAARRFGKEAASEIVMAWREIEAAQQIQSDHTYYWHHLRPNWAGPVLQSPLTPEALRSVELHGGEPPKPWGKIDYAPHRDDIARTKALGPALWQVASHFEQALEHLRKARVLMPPDHKSALDHWYAPEKGAPAIFTAQQLLDEQITAVMTHEKTQRRMSRFFAEYARVKSPE